MAKEETYELKGTVIDIKRNDKCIVEVDINGKKKLITASISGKIRTFRIRITKGDYVTVCMTKYDQNQGRITFREKDPKKAAEAAAERLAENAAIIAAEEQEANEI